MMSTNEEIWEKLKSERGTIDTSDCGAIEGKEGYVECDDEYTCPKHRQQVEDDIANAFRAEGYKEGQADSLRFAIAHMRIARSSMCLKDRTILLNKMKWLETELKKLEE